MLTETMAAPKAPRKPSAPKKPPSLYAQVGEEARKREQKKLLLKTLREHGWNLAHTAEALGLSGSAGVIRALLLVAPEEYEKARVEEKIRAGARRGE